MKRREFISRVALATALTPMLTQADESADESGEKTLPRGSFRVFSPFSGAVLHERHDYPVLGTEIVADGSDGSKTLKIRVEGEVLPGFENVRLTLDGKPLDLLPDGKFFGVATLRKQENTLRITSSAGDSRLVKVFWAQKSQPRFRLQVDDNSFFLRDIFQHEYRSIFDCFYLRMWRDFHEKFGLKVALNCFFSTPEKDFDLSVFPEKYRSEWEANADWLGLTFHARNEFPDEPYANASWEEVAKDFDLVATQLRRIAGCAYRAPGIVHWGELQREVHPLFVKNGARTLSGYFRKTAQNTYPVSFKLPNDVCEYMSTHDGWVDERTGLVFSKIEFVINSTPLDRIQPLLEVALSSPQTAEVVDLLTHEQYFWPFYRNYLPDHRQRVETALKFLTDRGYVSVFLDDGFFGTGA